MDEEKEDPYKHVCVQTDTHTNIHKGQTDVLCMCTCAEGVLTIRKMR